jgi:hypothetical protein
MACVIKFDSIFFVRLYLIKKGEPDPVVKKFCYIKKARIKRPFIFVVEGKSRSFVNICLCKIVVIFDLI